jgi:hypothetical protein
MTPDEIRQRFEKLPRMYGGLGTYVNRDDVAALIDDVCEQSETTTHLGV